MSTNILDTIVITFGDSVSEADKDSFYSWIDYDPVLNGDKVSFGGSDEVNILVHIQPGFMLSSIKQSSGMVRYNGKVSRSGEQELAFFSTVDDSLSLNQYPTTKPIFAGYGNQATLTLKDRNVQASNAPSIGKINYNFSAHSLTIIPPGNLQLTGEMIWPIGISIMVEKL